MKRAQHSTREKAGERIPLPGRAAADNKDSKLETESRKPVCTGRIGLGNSSIGWFEAGILMKTKIKIDAVRAHCRHCRAGRVSKTSRVPRGGEGRQKKFLRFKAGMYMKTKDRLT